MAKNKLPIDLSDLTTLQPQDLRFIGAYCVENNFDEVAAYRKAYPNKARGMQSNEARLEALEVLNRREVKIAVQRFVDSVLSPFRDRLDHQLLTVLRKRAFFDVATFFHADGSPKKLLEIPEEDRIVIDGVLQDAKGKDATTIVTTLKLGDRTVAMKQLQELLKKADDATSAVEVSDDNKKRLNDIFKNVNIQVNNYNGQNALKRREAQESDTSDADYEQIENRAILEPPTPINPHIIDSAIEQDPAVVKAKQIVSKINAGFDNFNHPLVQQAREAVAAKRGARGKS